MSNHLKNLNALKKGVIQKCIEDDITVFRIIGFENDPQGYKKVYLALSQDLHKQRVKIWSSGKGTPVIRQSHASMEIH